MPQKTAKKPPPQDDDLVGAAHPPEPEPAPEPPPPEKVGPKPVSDAVALFRGGHKLAKIGDPPTKWLCMTATHIGNPPTRVYCVSTPVEGFLSELENNRWFLVE